MTLTGEPGEAADREIATARVIDASPARVFDAFRDPARLARWWGPAGFTNTFQTFDLRPGGVWRYVMHGPNGANFRNESRVVEVVPGERIVLDHVSGPRFRLTIELAAQGAGTRLSWRMRFDTAAECDKVKGFAVAANEQNLDRLQAELGTPGRPETA